MISKFFHTILLALLFMSCNAQKKKNTTNSNNNSMPKTASAVVNSTYPKDKPQNNIIRLKENENKFLTDQQMNVTFKRVVSDSRCPMNARCVTAGNAVIEIEVMTTTSRPSILKLSAYDYGSDSQVKKSVAFAGYKIKLENLYPSSSTEVGFEELKGKYVIDLSIDKQ